jgi:hypothetical protein
MQISYNEHVLIYMFTTILQTVSKITRDINCEKIYVHRNT